jgi:hypothetical protein
MAKEKGITMAKKMSADMYSNAKPTKKVYAKSHEEYIGSPGLQGGRTAKAKADLQKAIKGGAAKTAKKLAPKDKVKTIPSTYPYANKDIKYTSFQQEAKRKKITGNIINDKSKTAMRAKIIEMNAVKKTKKK